MLVRFALLLACVARASATDTPAWDGTYFDPDELTITLTRTGSTVLAHSADWEITGTLTSETRARLAGLDGALSETGITWSNGVTWSKQQVLTPKPPPGWAGTYHAQKANIDIRVTQQTDTKVVAEGTRCARMLRDLCWRCVSWSCSGSGGCTRTRAARPSHPPCHSPTRVPPPSHTFPNRSQGKKFKADGFISGDTISMFGITGKLSASDSSVIHWSNREEWRKALPAVAVVARPPPPPLLAAGVAGAQPDYWAASFASAAAHANDPSAASTSSTSGSAATAAHAAPTARPPTRAGSAPTAAAAAAAALDAELNDAGNDPFLTSSDDDMTSLGDDMTDLAGGDSTWAAAAVGGTWEATHGGQPSSKRSHPLTTLLLLLVFLTLAGAIAFAVGSYRRHGTTDKQLLLDDWRALQDAIRAKASGGVHVGGGMERVHASEEEAELKEMRADGGLTSRIMSALATLGAAASVVMSAIGREPEVASAADDAPAAGRNVRAADDDDDEGGGSHAVEFETPSKYEWEGEKLSWEAGSGPPPDNLPDYADYTEESGEVC